MSQNKKSNLFYTLSVILLATLITVAIIYGWTEPSSAPPAGNVSAPLNVSTTTQYKGGALGIGGLLRVYSDAIFDGNVGIGTTSPGAKLDVQGGNINVSGSIVLSPQTAPPASPAKGQLYFDVSASTFKFYDGSNWRYLDSGYMSGLIDYLGSTYTRKQCVDAGGSVTPISGDGTNTEVCKFTGTNVNCYAGWQQANIWQSYTVSSWGGDSCGNHLSYGPTTFSKTAATEYYGGSAIRYPTYYCQNLQENQWRSYSGGGTGADLQLLYTNNPAHNRNAIGCK